MKLIAILLGVLLGVSLTLNSARSDVSVEYHEHEITHWQTRLESWQNRFPQNESLHDEAHMEIDIIRSHIEQEHE
jgi:hypothetical protein